MKFLLHTSSEGAVRFVFKKNAEAPSSNAKMSVKDIQSIVFSSEVNIVEDFNEIRHDSDARRDFLDSLGRNNAAAVTSDLGIVLAGRLSTKVDGDSGPSTRLAIALFQYKHGLGVDSIVGRKTKETLRNVASRSKLKNEVVDSAVQALEERPPKAKSKKTKPKVKTVKKEKAAKPKAENFNTFKRPPLPNHRPGSNSPSPKSRPQSLTEKLAETSAIEFDTSAPAQGSLADSLDVNPPDVDVRTDKAVEKPSSSGAPNQLREPSGLPDEMVGSLDPNERFELSPASVLDSPTLPNDTGLVNGEVPIEAIKPNHADKTPGLNLKAQALDGHLDVGSSTNPKVKKPSPQTRYSDGYFKVDSVPNIDRDSGSISSSSNMAEVSGKLNETIVSPNRKLNFFRFGSHVVNTVSSLPRLIATTRPGGKGNELKLKNETREMLSGLYFAEGLIQFELKGTEVRIPVSMNGDAVIMGETQGLKDMGYGLMLHSSEKEGVTTYEIALMAIEEKDAMEALADSGARTLVSGAEAVSNKEIPRSIDLDQTPEAGLDESDIDVSLVETYESNADASEEKVPGASVPGTLPRRRPKKRDYEVQRDMASVPMPFRHPNKEDVTVEIKQTEPGMKEQWTKHEQAVSKLPGFGYGGGFVDMTGGKVFSPESSVEAKTTKEPNLAAEDSEPARRLETVSDLLPALEIKRLKPGESGVIARRPDGSSISLVNNTQRLFSNIRLQPGRIALNFVEESGGAAKATLPIEIESNGIGLVDSTFFDYNAIKTETKNGDLVLSEHENYGLETVRSDEITNTYEFSEEALKEYNRLYKPVFKFEGKIVRISAMGGADIKTRRTAAGDNQAYFLAEFPIMPDNEAESVKAEVKIKVDSKGKLTAEFVRATQGNFSYEPLKAHVIETEQGPIVSLTKVGQNPESIKTLAGIDRKINDKATKAAAEAAAAQKTPSNWFKDGAEAIVVDPDN